MKKIAFWIPLFCVIVLSLANVVWSSQMVNKGEKLHDLENQVYSLRAQQKELEEVLASSQSLQAIQDEALAQGYVPVSKLVYLDGVKTVALR